MLNGRPISARARLTFPLSDQLADLAAGYVMAAQQLLGKDPGFKAALLA